MFKSNKNKGNEYRRLFYDIETSFGIYCSFGQGWNKTIGYQDEIVEPRIICICYKWEGDKKVHYLKWDEGDDKKMIEDFIKVLNQADEIIAHNGDGFDLPWIRARAIKHRVDMRWDYPITDTLKMAKKRAGKGFKFQSNRLDYIARTLGLGAKIKTDQQWWKDITYPCFLPDLFPMGTDYTEALAKMVKYCKMDVEVLENVFKVLAPYTQHNYHAGISVGGKIWDCPRCGSENVHKRGVTVSKAGVMKKRLSCNDCGGQHQISMTDLAKFEEFKKVTA